MKTLNILACGILVVLCGCAEGTGSAESGQTTAGQTAAGQAKPAGNAAFLLPAEPAEALPVGTARESVQNDQEVSVVGRIGGSEKPFVDGIAAFTIVDLKVQYCADDEGCPTPWDYCCHQDDVKSNIATVRIVDEAGKPVTGDARELLGVKELSEVVVQGKAKKDDHGNLSLAASKVFVRSGK